MTEEKNSKLENESFLPLPNLNEIQKNTTCSYIFSTMGIN
jgi:hypothetical protein